MHVEAADRAVAAGAVFHHELNVALGFDLGGDQSTKGIDAAARRHRHDDADRTAGKTRLRACDARPQQRSAGQDRCDGFAAVHRQVSPWRPPIPIPLRPRAMQI
jgi:hypothetical protein